MSVRDLRALASCGGTAESEFAGAVKSITMAQAKMLFGFLLLICISTLSAVIAIGHVRQETSYGLPEILGGLLVLAGGFANWAFGESRSSSGSTPKPPEDGTP